MLIYHLRLRSFFPRLRQTILGFILLVALLGCRSPVIRVEQSAQKVGKTVYLSGQVIRLAPFLGNGAYQINDGTGAIWVVTTKPLPQSNQQVNIKGKIAYQSLPLAEQELGDFYLVEQERSLPVAK